MADVRLSQLPQAPAITGSERVPLVQEVGQPIGPAALTVGLAYKIVSLGSTNWAAIGAGASPVVGLAFVATATGTGTGQAVRLETRTASAAEIAARAPGTDLAWVPSTLKITSSTGNDAQLTLATPTEPGLVSPTDQAFIDTLQDGSGNITLAGLTVAGTANLEHIHGAMAGPVYEHVKNVSGGTMAALTPYRILDSQGDTEVARIVPARSDNSALMPASGILKETLADNAEGHGVIAGVITGANTTGLTLAAQQYVAPTGGLTATRPPANVQAIAIPTRIHANTGTLVVALGPSLAAVASTGAYVDLASRPPEATQSDAEAGTGTTFSLWSPQRWRQAAAAWWLTVSGAFGRSLATATTSAEGRAALELGTAAQAATGDFVAAAAPRAANVFLAGPASGASAAPTFRAMVAGDLPSSAAFTGTLRAPLNRPAAPDQASGQFYLQDGIAYYRDANGIAGTEQRLLVASGNLQNLTDPFVGLLNIFFSSNGGPILANAAVGISNGGTGAAATISGAASSSNRLGNNILATGTTSTGGAGVSLFAGATFANLNGKHTLQSLSRFRCTHAISVDTLSDLTDTFMLFVGGYSDHTSGYATRSSFGAIIIGNTVYACATSNGVETLSSTGIVINAAQQYRIDVGYDGTTLSVWVDNSAPLTLTTGFPLSTRPLMWGAFILKTNGTASRTARIGNPGLMIAQTALP